jgi:hypothetical protein
VLSSADGETEQEDNGGEVAKVETLISQTGLQVAHTRINDKFISKDLRIGDASNGYHYV